MRPHILILLHWLTGLSEGIVIISNSAAGLVFARLLISLHAIRNSSQKYAHLNMFYGQHGLIRHLRSNS